MFQQSCVLAAIISKDRHRHLGKDLVLNPLKQTKTLVVTGSDPERGTETLHKPTTSLKSIMVNVEGEKQKTPNLKSWASWWEAEPPSSFSAAATTQTMTALHFDGSQDFKDSVHELAQLLQWGIFQRAPDKIKIWFITHSLQPGSCWVGHFRCLPCSSLFLLPSVTSADLIVSGDTWRAWLAYRNLPVEMLS